MSGRTRIKICGVRRLEDVEAAAAAGADAIGLVFHPGSPRHVSLEVAARLAAGMPPFMTAVGLFVNAAPAGIAQACAAIPGLLLQFHGDETPDDCASFHRPYLKAARMTAAFDLREHARRFAGSAGLVLDAHVEAFGGSGTRFDWSLVPAEMPCPLVLSGGLTAANVGAGIAELRPWAVDVSSGVESSRGVKDAAAIARFCAAVRAADRASAYDGDPRQDQHA